jgi:hypothetical protein
MSALPTSDAILAAITATPEKEDHAFAQTFRQRNEADQMAGWSWLSELFGFHFRPADASAPFGPMAQMDGKRTMIPDDLTEQQLDVLLPTPPRARSVIRRSNK